MCYSAAESTIVGAARRLRQPPTQGERLPTANPKPSTPGNMEAAVPRAANPDPTVLAAILDSLADPVLLADTDHVIRYMNSAAVSHYEEGEQLLGTSLLACHNERSQTVIHEVLAALQGGETERLITDEPHRRIYMRAVRSERGELIGYYERYEKLPGQES